MFFSNKPVRTSNHVSRIAAFDSATTVQEIGVRLVGSEMCIRDRLMSYITSTFQTKSDMRVAEEEWQRIIQEMSSRFKSAGALRQTVSQVWNKEGVFMLGNMWEYKDEKAFIACQTLFREAEKKLDERTSIVVKNFAIRGIILHDVFF